MRHSVDVTRSTGPAVPCPEDVSRLARFCLLRHDDAQTLLRAADLCVDRARTAWIDALVMLVQEGPTGQPISYSARLALALEYARSGTG